MVDEAVINGVRQYLRRLAAHGIPTRLAVVFGSQASGHGTPWSDVDLIVISPVFDGCYSRDLINRLWREAARTDSRIEPIPCGVRQWREDTATPILEVARREGIAVEL